LYYKAALEKDIDAMYWVGECLIEGIGVERDVPKGVKYLLDVGAAGHLWAFSRLAHYYQRGIGVAENKKKSLRLYLAWGILFRPMPKLMKEKCSQQRRRPQRMHGEHPCCHCVPA